LSAAGPGIGYAYDALGRVTSETSANRTLSYQYDAAGNRTRVTWPDTGANSLYVAYIHDVLNRVTMVEENGATSGPGLLASHGHDSLGRRSTVARAGGAGASTSTIGYDNAERMNALAHVFAPTTGNQTWGFGFTPASQLATTSSANAAWNWTASTASAVNTVADGLNRNAAVAGVTQTYDRFGNLTSDGTRACTYDTENRPLTESGPVTLALSYDPMGRLQQSVINGTTTQFLYDGDTLVGEYPASGNTPLRRYVHGVGTDNPLMWYEGATMTAANANYLLTDRQGSIVGTGNSSGALTANYTYDPHGAPSTWGTVGTVPRFRYTGQAAIPEARLYQYKARVYDPVSGRFLQTDPVGYGPGVNWYADVHNDPVNNADPTGDDAWQVAWDVVEVVSGGASVVGGAIVTGAGAVTEGATLGASTPVSVPAVGLGTLAIGGGAVVFGNGIKDIVQGSTSESRPFKGTPGSTVDDGHGQGRRYGPDGHPETDTDKSHDHNGAGDPH
jgi:RHS repeat-associated protein